MQGRHSVDFDSAQVFGSSGHSKNELSLEAPQSSHQTSRLKAAHQPYMSYSELDAQFSTQSNWNKKTKERHFRSCGKLVDIMNNTYDKYLPNLNLQSLLMPRKQYDRCNITAGVMRFRYKGDEVNLKSKLAGIIQNSNPIPVI